MTLNRIRVKSGAGTYAVLYGRGALAKAGAEVAALGNRTSVYLLTSPRVARHWRANIERHLRRAVLRDTILFDDREAAKSMATVERICRDLVRAGADRRAVLVALGGGVVGDVAGFAAASYLRGVKLVHIPTTLVAQVDSAIGGKTGVNLPEGKNLVGAFYPPQLVLADPDTLSTLNPREFRSGLYEVVKYGAIGDVRLFSYCEKVLDGILEREHATLDFVIPRCIRAKADIVGRDERESGLREILNFGHTFAHAFETATSYRRYLHGEAVGWGMIAAARLSARLALMQSEDAQRIEKLVCRIGSLPPLPRATPARLIEIMRSDKKTRAGKLRFVLSRRIGQAETVEGVAVSDVRHILSDLANQRSGKP